MNEEIEPVMFVKFSERPPENQDAMMTHQSLMAIWGLKGSIDLGVINNIERLKTALFRILKFDCQLNKTAVCYCNV